MIEAGIEYIKPKVYLLQESGLGTSEVAGRIAYNSFNNSENKEILEFNNLINGLYDDDLKKSKNFVLRNQIKDVNDIKDSELLNSLAWVHHHHSVLEHCNLTFLVKGTSRGVLQEHARHRIQSITVQSTRYTMSPVLYAFLSSDSFETFKELLQELDFLVVKGEYRNIVLKNIFDKLSYQFNAIGEEAFIKLSLSKENIERYYKIKKPKELYTSLLGGKTKRNAGDYFKHIVDDNWKVDMVFTMNLRSLKNYLELRDSGAAYFQIRWLAEEVKQNIPKKYLKLISKEYR